MIIPALPQHFWQQEESSLGEDIEKKNHPTTSFNLALLSTQISYHTSNVPPQAKPEQIHKKGKKIINKKPYLHVTISCSIRYNRYFCSGLLHHSM